MADISPIDVQKALKGAEYPASSDDLASLAESNGADDNVVEKLRSSRSKQYDGPDDVQKAVFGSGS
ncbi:hypothetical protein SUDANB120_05928 [Streptomyces sp. enrichment culture]|uniref:DUF2795 domain-containing protein n=1 Tax=Streptomyces TaxID=1883 RepID=UPI00167B6D95|nr:MULTISPECIES: DUF2795 domain-containing protein [Streptomyces]MBD3577686.1 DUF2795 domain-containing protein [Streptomyces sp. KD18]GGT09057.1 hypothetical protein GCM10010286_37990 [Streptomyces toxytricini]